MRACTTRLSQLFLLLATCSAVVRASSRVLLNEPAATDPAVLVASTDPQVAAATPSDASGDEGLVEPQAATPEIIRCKWKPDVYPRGYTKENWTADWPISCMGTPVGEPCRSVCKPGYKEQRPGYPPVVYCGPPKWKFGVWDTKIGGGWCKPIPVKPIKCGGQPSPPPNARWVNCSNALAGTSCTAVCDDGYLGDPAPPEAACVLDRSGTYARWVVNTTLACKDSTVCRDSPCNDIAYAIRDSCVPNYAGNDFTCTCFDYYKWDPAQKICVDASLLAFAVAQPVDGPPRSFIYKYSAKKATDIGKFKWIVQDNGTSAANMYDVAIADNTTAWAVGEKGLIKKYDGTIWSTEQDVGTNKPDLLAVAALSKSRAWVGGTDGAAKFWDGSTWADVKVNNGRNINSITAATDANGQTVVWAVAGDERDPNHLWAYIYKWGFKDKKWELFQEFENITLRGVSALDGSAAWACGFTNRGPSDERGVALVYDANAGNWTRQSVKLPVNGYARLVDIVAINYRKAYAAGYWENANSPSGTVPLGLVAEWDGKAWVLRYSFGTVATFSAIDGVSPSTTVAVGQFDDDAAEGWGWGYPAENWQKWNFADRAMRSNASVAKDQAFSGVGMKYI